MHIPFTPEEYRTLLDLAYIADTVVHGDDAIDEARNRPYWELVQKILARAQDFGGADLVAFNNARKAYFVTKEYEDTSPAGELIDGYEDNIFWDLLVDRLAQRDITRHFSEDELLSMSFEDRNAREEEYRTRYWDEFEKNGLDHVTVTPHALRNGPGWRTN